jgi:hypothetical protein
MAAGDLTTLTVVKGYLPGLEPTDNSFDTLLTRLITSVSTQFTTEVGRSLASETAAETYNGHGGQRLTPARWPVTAVTSLVVDGETIAARAALGESGYIIDGQTSVVLDGYYYARGTQNVVLTYTAGFVTIPADVEQAVVKMVCLQFRDKDRIGKSSGSAQGESVSYADGPVLAAWRNTVESYRAQLLG